MKTFANRRAAFSRTSETPTIESTNTPMIAIVERELATINRTADELTATLDALEGRAIAHKKEHMLSWAKRGLPETDGDDDFRGVRLGEAMEDALKTRRDAIAVAKSKQLAKLPLIVEPVAPDHSVEDLTEDELLALAAAKRRR